jgi:hypothetical protein
VMQSVESKESAYTHTRKGYTHPSVCVKVHDRRGCRHEWSGRPAAPHDAEPLGGANEGRCRARALVHAHTAEPALPPHSTLNRWADGTKGAAAHASARPAPLTRGFVHSARTLWTLKKYSVLLTSIRVTPCSGGCDAGTPDPARVRRGAGGPRRPARSRAQALCTSGRQRSCALRPARRSLSRRANTRCVRAIRKPSLAG